MSATTTHYPSVATAGPISQFANSPSSQVTPGARGFAWASCTKPARRQRTKVTVLLGRYRPILAALLSWSI